MSLKMVVAHSFFQRNLAQSKAELSAFLDSIWYFFMEIEEQWKTYLFFLFLKWTNQANADSYMMFSSCKYSDDNLVFEKMISVLKLL